MKTKITFFRAKLSKGKIEFGVSVSSQSTIQYNKGYPIVLQYNKRDCSESIPLGTMEREFDLKNVPVKEAVAISGRGVMETINHLCKEIVRRFTI